MEYGLANQGYRYATDELFKIATTGAESKEVESPHRAYAIPVCGGGGTLQHVQLQWHQSAAPCDGEGEQRDGGRLVGRNGTQKMLRQILQPGHRNRLGLRLLV
jgi:hypothetical protein